MKERVVLAYSGGLDTSVAIGWIAEETGAEVIAVAGDVGQGGEDMDVIRRRALDCGAVESIVAALTRSGTGSDGTDSIHVSPPSVDESRSGSIDAGSAVSKSSGAVVKTSVLVGPATAVVSRWSVSTTCVHSAPSTARNRPGKQDHAHRDA